MIAITRTAREHWCRWTSKRLQWNLFLLFIAFILIFFHFLINCKIAEKKVYLTTENTIQFLLIQKYIKEVIKKYKYKTSVGGGGRTKMGTLSSDNCFFTACFPIIKNISLDTNYLPSFITERLADMKNQKLMPIYVGLLPYYGNGMLLSGNPIAHILLLF